MKSGFLCNDRHWITCFTISMSREVSEPSVGQTLIGHTSMAGTELTEMCSLPLQSLLPSGQSAWETLLTLVRERPWPWRNQGRKARPVVREMLLLWALKKEKETALGFGDGQNRHGVLSRTLAKIQPRYFVGLDIRIFIISRGDSIQREPRPVFLWFFLNQNVRNYIYIYETC